MATLNSLISRVRRELGDLQQTFRSTARGDGDQDTFDIPATNVSSLSITKVYNSVVTTLAPADFTLDAAQGNVTFTTVPQDGAVLMFEGTQTGLFTDDEITQFINDAFLQHTHGQTVSTRYRDTHGFIEYDTQPMTLEMLPEVEELLVAMLATITDASTDIDVQSAEGTSIARSQRYTQMLHQIDILTAKYIDLCQQLNVGLHRIEVSTLRRVSRTTGRFIPVFVEREYDDHRLPDRELAPIDRRDVDESGVPSPTYGGQGF
jgi:hypothetical protein